MSYSHPRNLAGKPAPTGGSAGPPVDPALWWREDMRAALWVRDILRRQVLALLTIEHGHPDDGLKMLQLGQVTAGKIPLDLDRSTVLVGEGSRVALEACGLADSATALARLGNTEAAYRHLGQSRELWTPTRADPYGDLDIVAARLELDRGRLDTAEQFATASLRRWEGPSVRSRTTSSIVLATVHGHVSGQVAVVGRCGQHLGADIRGGLGLQVGGDGVDQDQECRRHGAHGAPAELVVEGRQVVGHGADCVDLGVPIRTCGFFRSSSNRPLTSAHPGMTSTDE